MLKSKYERFLPDNVKTTRFAEEDEIKNAYTKIEIGSKQDFGGLPIISNGKETYIDAEDNHTLIYGSTGSKKTRVFIRPIINSLIAAGESIVINDPKGELYETTAGYASKSGYEIVVLNFRDLDTGAQWNPLLVPFKLYCKKETRESGISMLNEFIQALSTKEENLSDKFWDNTSESLLLGCALLLFEFAKRELPSNGINPELIVNLRNLVMLSNSISSDVDYPKLVEIANRIPFTSLCSINLKGVLQAADKTRQSIAVSLFSLIKDFFLNKTLIQMMEKSSFDFAELASSGQKYIIYLISPDESRKYDNLISIFINQSYTEAIRVAQNEDNKRLKNRLNYVLDEFSNLPVIEGFSSMISAGRSRGMRFYLAIQNNMKKYGDEASTIKGNVSNLVLLYSKELDLLKEISELCGNDENGNRLLTVSELQHFVKEREYSEALLLLDRNYPFVSKLPDIDIYSFPFFNAPKITKRKEVSEQYTARVDFMLKEAKDRFKNYFGEECNIKEKNISDRQ